MTSGPLFWVQVVLGCVLLAVALLALLVWLRRRAIGRGQPVVLCGMRAPGDTHWHRGLLRYDTSRLDWFRLGGFSVRPQHRWQRAVLDLGAPRELEGWERALTPPSAMGVPCRYLGESFDLTLTSEQYTALRSWTESCPPGYNVNVA